MGGSLRLILRPTPANSGTKSSSADSTITCASLEAIEPPTGLKSPKSDTTTPPDGDNTNKTASAKTEPIDPSLDSTVPVTSIQPPSGGKDVAKYAHSDDKRSRRARHKDDSQLFDFDIDLTEPVPLTSGLALSEQGARMTAKIEQDYLLRLHPSEQVSIPLNMEPYSYEKPQPGIFEDPLDDAVFDGDHKRMEREEKRIQMSERNRIITEKDRLVAQLEQLESAEWLRYIGGITKVHNMGDKEELQRKRELTMKECKYMIKGYEKFREREKEYTRVKKELALAMQSDPKYADRDLYAEKGGYKYPPQVSLFYYRALEEEEQEEEEEEEEEDGDDESEEEDEEDSVKVPAKRSGKSSRSNGGGSKKAKSARAVTGGKTIKSMDSLKKDVKAKSKSQTPKGSHPPATPPPPKPFISFFENPKLCPSFEDMIKLRRSRRAPVAFGKPIPEMEELEFEIPWWAWPMDD